MCLVFCLAFAQLLTSAYYLVRSAFSMAKIVDQLSYFESWHYGSHSSDARAAGLPTRAPLVRTPARHERRGPPYPAPPLSAEGVQTIPKIRARDSSFE